MYGDGLIHHAVARTGSHTRVRLPGRPVGNEHTILPSDISPAWQKKSAAVSAAFFVADWNRLMTSAAETPFLAAIRCADS
jgi:hypothetical protein